MTPDTQAEYMELVRTTWLQCRGPQRQYAKAILDRYDMAKRERRNQMVKAFWFWILRLVL